MSRIEAVARVEHLREWPYFRVVIPRASSESDTEAFEAEEARLRTWLDDRGIEPWGLIVSAREGKKAFVIFITDQAQATMAYLGLMDGVD